MLDNASSAGPCRTRWRWNQTLTVARSVLFALLLVGGAEALRVGLGSNFHAVVARRCYRCGQPSNEALKELIRSFGIRTVVNLRGDNVGEDWYEQEIDTTGQQGALFQDVGLTAYDPPEVDEFRRLVRVLDRSPEPILLHCHSGGDRSGLASVAFLLLKTDCTLAEARGQLSLRYGHLPWGRATCQDRVIDDYERWLGERRVGHSAARFRQWADRYYRP